MYICSLSPLIKFKSKSRDAEICVYKEKLNPAEKVCIVALMRYISINEPKAVLVDSPGLGEPIVFE